MRRRRTLLEELSFLDKAVKCHTRDLFRYQKTYDLFLRPPMRANLSCDIGEWQISRKLFPPASNSVSTRHGKTKIPNPNQAPCNKISCCRYRVSS